MSEFIELIATSSGNKQINYNALANIPKINNTDIVGNVTITPSDIGADSEGSASAALNEAKSYADTAANKVKDDLLNGAGSAYDTLKELGDLIDVNVDAIDALETVAAGKADKNHTHPTDTSRASKTEFDSHDVNTTKHITATERTNWNSAKTHADSTHAPSDAEKNQNAFSNIKVGNTTVSAENTTDTLELQAGENINLVTDTTNDKITISARDTWRGVYVNSTYVPANRDIGFFNSRTIKTGVETNAPDCTEITFNITDNEHKHIIENVTNLQSSLDSKVPITRTINGKSLNNNIELITSDIEHKHNTNTYNLQEFVNSMNYDLSTIDSKVDDLVDNVNQLDVHVRDTSNPHNVSLSNLGVSANASELNKLYGCTTTTDELNYLSGSTSNIQTQLNTLTNDLNTDVAASLRMSTSTENTLVFNNANGTEISRTTINLNLLSKKADNYKKGNELPSTYPVGEYIFFSNNPDSRFNNIQYCTIHTVKGYNGTACIQYLYPYNTNTNEVWYRQAKYGLDEWQSWRQIMTSLDYDELQSVLDTKADSSHGTHVTYSTALPIANGTAAVGSATTVSRSDHVHPLQTSVSGNAGTATKLANSRTLQTDLSSTSAAGFDGSVNQTIGVTGTLSLANGGTNATSASGARTNLDVYSKEEVDNRISTITIVRWS